MEPGMTEARSQAGICKSLPRDEGSHNHRGEGGCKGARSHDRLAFEASVQRSPQPGDGPGAPGTAEGEDQVDNNTFHARAHCSPPVQCPEHACSFGGTWPIGTCTQLS